jgi:predicted amidohydrolase YtcJ
MTKSVRCPLRAAVVVAALVLALTGIGACNRGAPPAQAGGADLVLKNARIYTVDTSRPWASAVAIRDGRIVAVGSDEEAAKLAGKQTQVIDLGGKLVLPAFHDAHAHPVWGGLSYSQCPLYAGNSPADYQRIIAKCVADEPGTGWIVGFGWRDGLFEPEGVPTKELLDEVTIERPLVFHSVGGHSIWLNSKALQLAGITRDTRDPPNGRIDRDANGEPIGALQESATELVAPFLPPPSDRAQQDGLRYGLRYFNGAGIVGWQDASVPIGPAERVRIIDTYAALHRSGELKAHTVLALTWDNARGVEQVADLQAAAEKARSQGLDVRTIKFFVDGVLAQRTAALIEPYADQRDLRGGLQIAPDALREAMVRLDAHGFQIHVHAIGDQAVRSTLDALTVVEQRNGKKDRRSLISHTNLVAADDWKRFADLGVTSVFQPLWARLDEYMRMTGVRVGSQRMEHMYPSASLQRAGAKVAYGSDWAVASANPFEGIEVALTHRASGATDGEVLSPVERVTLEQAIASYTRNAAYASFKDDVSGSIEPGKSADLVVPDRDLFRIPVLQIAKTRVLLTLYAGQAVHGDLSAVAAGAGE